MFLVDDPDEPGGNRQWLCDAQTKRHVKSWDEVVGLRDHVGVFHFTELESTLAIRRALLAARVDVTPT